MSGGACEYACGGRWEECAKKKKDRMSVGSKEIISGAKNEEAWKGLLDNQGSNRGIVLRKEYTDVGKERPGFVIMSSPQRDEVLPERKKHPLCTGCCRNICTFPFGESFRNRSETI